MTVQTLLTKSDLGKLLQVSTRTIDKRRAAGEVLDPIAGSGQPRWDPEEVAAWIKAGRPNAEVWQRSRSRRR
jgi:hypothetical protein